MEESILEDLGVIIGCWQKIITSPEPIVYVAVVDSVGNWCIESLLLKFVFDFFFFFFFFFFELNWIEILLFFCFRKKKYLVQSLCTSFLEIWINFPPQFIIILLILFIIIILLILFIIIIFFLQKF